MGSPAEDTRHGLPLDEGLEQASRRSSLAFVWAIVAALLGGYLCGLGFSHFGQIGLIFLGGLGVFAGWVGRKLIAQPSRAVGWSLVASCIVACAISLVCWIRWNIVGAETWWAALRLLPAFLKQYQTTVLIGAIFTLFGGLSAYRQTTRF
jgi:hypothetical protein